MVDLFYWDELSCFEFPFNLLGGIVMVALCIILSLYCKNKYWVKKITGIGFTLVWMAVLILILIVEGIFAWKLYCTWCFIILWLVFLFHLGMVIIRRMNRWNRRNTLFLLNHLGVWITVAALFFGTPDVKTLKMIAPLEQAEDKGIDENGCVHTITFNVVLQKFHIEYHDGEQKIPRHFCSELLLRNQDKEKRVNLEVNKPVSYGGYVLYLDSYDIRESQGTGYVILQLVREPWMVGVYGGIVMILAGSLGLIIYGPVKRKRYGLA